MIDDVRHFLGVPKEPSARMTREEAFASARQVASAAGLNAELNMANVRREGIRMFWVVGMPTVGSGWTVEIDDATGVAGELQSWGVR